MKLFATLYQQCLHLATKYKSWFKYTLFSLDASGEPVLMLFPYALSGAIKLGVKLQSCWIMMTISQIL